MDWRRALWAGGLLLAGCVHTQHAEDPGPPPVHLPPPPAADEPHGVQVPANGPLTLERLLDLAAQNNPDVRAARARAEAARGRLIQAGLYPNPILYHVMEEVNNPGGRWGFQ